MCFILKGEGNFQFTLFNLFKLRFVSLDLFYENTKHFIPYGIWKFIVADYEDGRIYNVQSYASLYRNLYFRLHKLYPKIHTFVPAIYYIVINNFVY